MRDIRWWRLGPSVLMLVAASWVLLTRWSVIWASHPVFPITLIVVVVVSSALLVSSFVPGRGGARWRRGWVITGRVVGIVLALVVAGSLVYLRPFAAELPAGAMDTDASTSVTEAATSITLAPVAVAPTAGLVFWPGARVDARAYVPLLRPIAADSVLVVIVKEPFGISFLDGDAASDVLADHPEIATWSVGGHSLGGVTASAYAGGHDSVSGLLLWASYPQGSLADRQGLAVVSVSGTQDGLTTPADIEASKVKLPPSTTFVAIDGGVHAFFADYGEQPGDGTPTISREDAQEQIVAASLRLFDPA